MPWAWDVVFEDFEYGNWDVAFAEKDRVVAFLRAVADILGLSVGTTDLHTKEY